MARNTQQGFDYSDNVDNDTSATLFAVFFDSFDSSVIFELGWYAAQSSMAVISVVVLAVAILIRSVEEKANLVMGKDTNYRAMVATTLMITLAVASYFGAAHLLIKFYNALYGSINTSSLGTLGDLMDKKMNALWAKEYQFKLSEIGDSLFAVGGMIIYWITHLILVCVAFAMKVAHTVLFSFILFWGTIALPISISKGLKMLKPFGILVIFAVIWPIIEAFFVYLVVGVFQVTLDQPGLAVEEFNRLTMGKLVFFYMAFAAINLLVAATLVSAPFVAQALATGSGNVSGMIASFAAAGVGAGAMIGEQLKKRSEQTASAAQSKGAAAIKYANEHSGPMGQPVGSLVKGAYDAMKPQPKPPAPNWSNLTDAKAATRGSSSTPPNGGGPSGGPGGGRSTSPNSSSGFSAEVKPSFFSNEKPFATASANGSSAVPSKTSSPSAENRTTTSGKTSSANNAGKNNWANLTQASSLGFDSGQKSWPNLVGNGNPNKSVGQHRAAIESITNTFNSRDNKANTSVPQRSEAQAVAGTSRTNTPSKNDSGSNLTTTQGSAKPAKNGWPNLTQQNSVSSLTSDQASARQTIDATKRRPQRSEHIPEVKSGNVNSSSNSAEATSGSIENLDDSNAHIQQTKSTKLNPNTRALGTDNQNINKQGTAANRGNVAINSANTELDTKDTPKQAKSVGNAEVKKESTPLSKDVPKGPKTALSKATALNNKVENELYENTNAQTTPANDPELSPEEKAKKQKENRRRGYFANKNIQAKKRGPRH